MIKDDKGLAMSSTILTEKQIVDLMFPIGSVVSNSKAGDGIIVERFDDKMLRVSFQGMPAMPFSNKTASSVLVLKEPKYTNKEYELLHREVLCGRFDILDFIVNSLGIEKAQGYLVPKVLKLEKYNHLYLGKTAAKEKRVQQNLQKPIDKPVVSVQKKTIIVKSNKPAVLVKKQQAKYLTNPTTEDWPHGIIVAQ